MTSITAEANTRVARTGPFWKRRYTIALFVNEVNTGLSWTVKGKHVNDVSKTAVDNAAELLVRTGRMDDVYDAVAIGQSLAAQAAKINEEQPISKAFSEAAVGTLDKPRKGQRVVVTQDIGNLKAGQIGTVVRVDDDDFYPIRVAFTMGADTVELPMNLSELKVAA